jgi:hypothetical protein
MDIWETMGMELEGKFYAVLWRGSMKKGGWVINEIGG